MTTLFHDQLTGFITRLKALDAPEHPRMKFWRKDPVSWLVERLGFPIETLEWSRLPAYRKHEWDGDVDPLATALRGLTTHRRVGVESGTTTGKTYSLVAGAVLWFMDCFKNATVVTLAPKSKQLELHGWKNISALWPRFTLFRPDAELTKLRIRFNEGSDVWAAHGFPVGVGAGEFSATKAQGFHDEHMLFVLEEMTGQDPAVVTAVEQTCKAVHNIILGVGNPDYQLDPLHMFCTAPDTLHVRISATDHPNIVQDDPSFIPGAVTRIAIESDKKRYGAESPFYRSRVRGISPAEAKNALIKLAWCYKAARSERPKGWQELERALGVDVANSEGGDPAAVARGRGPVCEQVEAFPCPDANKLGTDIAEEMDRNGIKDYRVGVDIIGVGVGTYNELKRRGHKVAGLNNGAGMVEHLEHLFNAKEKFANLRAQKGWLARMDLEHGRVWLPEDPELFMELTAATWTPEGGKITIEKKDKIKERLGRSPNKADAFIDWNWVRQVRMTVSSGGAMVNI